MSVKLSDKEIFDCKVKQAVVRYAIGGPMTLEDVLTEESRRVFKLESEVIRLRSELRDTRYALGYREQPASTVRLPWYRRIFS